MKSYDYPVVGFSGERVATRGYIDLYTTFGEGKANKTTKIGYLINDGEVCVKNCESSAMWLVVPLSKIHGFIEA